MTDLAGVLGELIPELQRLANDNVGPVEATAHVDEVTRHTGYRVDLVWDRDDVTGRCRYDALVDTGSGTLSIAYCPDDETPWPLRGAHRWSEQHVVRVNGQVKTIQHVAGWLEWNLWRDPSGSLRLVDHCLLEQEITARGIRASEDELQKAFDTFRSRRGLFSAADYERWLRTNGYAHVNVQALVELEVCAVKLREALVGQSAYAYFSEHAREFDRVTAVRCGPLEEPEVNELAAAVRRGNTSILREAAKRAPTWRNRPALVSYRRGEVADELVRPLFDARPGEIVGPLRTGEAFELLEIVETIESKFEDVRPYVLKVLFELWLQERRAKADVRWYWGSTDGAQLPPEP